MFSKLERLKIIEGSKRCRRLILSRISEDARADEETDVSQIKKIEINGIPYRKPENLQYILTKLSRHMFSEVMESKVVSIKRLRKAVKPRPILVHLKKASIGQELLTAYTEYNQRNRNTHLSSKDLGFKSMNIPVLISPHPSNQNKIHRKIVTAATLHNIRTKKKPTDDVKKPTVSHTTVSGDNISASTSATSASNKTNEDSTKKPIARVNYRIIRRTIYRFANAKTIATTENKIIAEPVPTNGERLPAFKNCTDYSINWVKERFEHDDKMQDERPKQVKRLSDLALSVVNKKKSG